MNNLENKRDVFKGHCNIIRLALCSSSDYAVKVPLTLRNPMNNDTPSLSITFRSVRGQRLRHPLHLIG